MYHDALIGSSIGNDQSVRRRSQQGLTLIEILIALVIAAGVLFGIFFLVGIAQDRTIVREESQAFQTMVNDARTKFRAQGSYAGITPAVLIQLGIVPPQMVNGNAIRSGWNTPVQVAPVNFTGQPNDGIQFTYSVPRRSCADFVDAVAPGAARIVIDNTVVKNTAATPPVNNVNVASVAAECDAGAGGNVNVLLTQGR
jgi:prepilin-type N-terminal cleavage/methylation domain-containing protein